MILFKKIRWKNFLSTGNQWTEVDFEKNNTNLIIGTNGAGKSTVLDALTFVLLINHSEKSINPNYQMQSMKRIVWLRMSFL